MRVIAGTYRSRQLTAPRGTETRPTSDRLRETLFNIIALRIPNCRFADLYAGTGAVGIEAISRGAAHVWFTEKSEPALAAIRANLKTLKITHGFTASKSAAPEPSSNASLRTHRKSVESANTRAPELLDLRLPRPHRGRPKPDRTPATLRTC